MTTKSGMSAKFLAATALVASAALVATFSESADAHGGRRYNPRAVPPHYGQTYYPGYRGGHSHDHDRHHHHHRHDHGHVHGQFNVYGGIGYGGYRGGYRGGYGGGYYPAPVYPNVPPAFAVPPVVPMPGICVTGPGFIIC